MITISDVMMLGKGHSSMAEHIKKVKCLAYPEGGTVGEKQATYLPALPIPTTAAM